VLKNKNKGQTLKVYQVIGPISLTDLPIPMAIYRPFKPIETYSTLAFTPVSTG
jgi:hypothetical protein